MNSGRLFMLVCAAAVCAACAPKQTEVQSEERAELVETSAITRTEIARQLDFSTTLEGYVTVNVAPSIQGRIEHISVEVGDKVSQGQEIVRMDQNQYNTTRLTFANLGIELKRMEALRQSGAVSEQAFDQLKLSYDQASESLSFLKKNTFVQAPFAGVISAKNYEDGELFSGLPVVVLTQINKLKALISIPESYYPEVKSGMNITIESEIYPGTAFDAVIETVYPTIDASTHTFQCKLRIPNSSLKLRPGMYVHTKLAMGKAETIVVPYNCVLKMTGSNDRYIFLDDSGTAKRVFVTMGQRFDQNIEIISDEIHEGDRIVTMGQARLVDGSKLNVTKEN